MTTNQGEGSGAVRPRAKRIQRTSAGTPRNQIHVPDFRARKSPDQAARPSRSGLALSGAPGGRQARAAGVRVAIPQEASAARSAAGAKASGIEARQGRD